MSMKKAALWRSAIFAAALFGEAALTPLQAETDIYGNEIKTVDGQTYQFFLSGNPEVAASADSASGESSAEAVTTGRLADSDILASELEARYRTCDDSDETSLDSTKYRATIILFR